MLRWLGRGAKAGRPIFHVSLMPDDLESDEALRNAFQTAHGPNRKFLTNFALTFAAAVYGVTVQLQTKDTGTGTGIPSKGNRLLITFDEAHLAPAARLRQFLNAVQSSAKGCLLGLSSPELRGLKTGCGRVAPVTGTAASSWGLAD